MPTAHISHLSLAYIGVSLSFTFLYISLSFCTYTWTTETTVLGIKKLENKPTESAARVGYSWHETDEAIVQKYAEKSSKKLRIRLSAFEYIHTSIYFISKLICANCTSYSLRTISMNDFIIKNYLSLQIRFWLVKLV